MSFADSLRMAWIKSKFTKKMKRKPEIWKKKKLKKSLFTPQKVPLSPR
jgi:hypothetical protein